MKNLILVFFFALLLTLTGGSCKAFSQVQDPPTISQAQDVQIDQVQQEAPQLEKEGILSSLATKAKEGIYTLIAGLIVGLLAKKGWLTKLKFYAGKATIAFATGSDLLMACSRLSNAIDNSLLKDNKLKENSLKEMLAAKKEVEVKFEDMIVVFKPKK